jgi:hypothetical protein
MSYPAGNFPEVLVLPRATIERVMSHANRLVRLAPVHQHELAVYSYNAIATDLLQPTFKEAHPTQDATSCPTCQHTGSALK